MHRGLMHTLAALLMGGLCAPLAFGQAAPAGDPPRSPAVQKASQEYDEAVRKAQAELAAARKAYLARLDAALKEVMQTGDLEEANRIDALRKAVRAGAETGGPAPGAQGAQQLAPADARRRPGWIVGSITDSAGHPIQGVAFEVNCFGTTIRGGERASFRLEVDEKGQFAQELPDGLYAATAYLQKDFAGCRFRIQLHPVDEKPDQTKLPSKPGIVKNFVWKLTGTRPGLDPRQPFAHHGGSVRLYDSQYLGDDEEKLTSRLGDRDAQVLVTLTPRGPLIDGSKGASIEIKAPLTTIGKTLGHVAMDIPFGPYTAQAQLVKRDGSKRALRCSTEFRGPFKDKAEFEFQQPGIYDSVKEVSIYINP